MRTFAKAAMAAILGAALLGVSAGAVSAHNVNKIVGTVDCSGNYSITVTGDIWGGVHLFVKLGGVQIVDEVENGNNQAVRDFGPFTGSGATAGEAISAKTESQTVSGKLVADPKECPTPEPPAPPSGPNTTCGGTVSFTDVPEGWKLIIEPGDVLVTSDFTGIKLDPGKYTYDFRNSDNVDQVSGEFTIGFCIPLPPTTVCGGSVTFPDQIDGYTIDVFQPAPDAAEVQPAAISFQVVKTVPFGSISLDPGVYGYQWFVGDPNSQDGIQVGDMGTFSIVVCPTAPPSASPVALHPTPPPTSTGTGSNGSGTSGMLIALLFAFGALGSAAVYTARRARS
jgi:hypothetical protein